MSVNCQHIQPVNLVVLTVGKPILNKGPSLKEIMLLLFEQKACCIMILYKIYRNRDCLILATIINCILPNLKKKCVMVIYAHERNNPSVKSQRSKERKISTD